MATLELQNLTKRFGAAAAVDGCSLDVAAGEIMALLGPSGCGKTTTLRMIAGFETPDEGSIAIGGAPVVNLPPWARDIGLVFQDYALFPHMTVAANICYGMQRRGVGRTEQRQRLAELLDLVQLTGLENRRPQQLSGGQQQRVALARALAIRPRLLLLDEPLSNLDAKLREHLGRELRAILGKVGTTTLIVTHDQAEAMSLADRIAVMRDGRILQTDRPQVVYGEPATAFVAAFLGRSNWLAGAVIASSDDGARHDFRTDDGMLLTVEGRIRVGRSHGVSIRPEAIRIGPVIGDENGLGGVVHAVTPLGSEVLVGVRLPTGRILDVSLRPTGYLPAAGETVPLSIPPAGCRLIVEDEVT